MQISLSKCVKLDVVMPDSPFPVFLSAFVQISVLVRHTNMTFQKKCMDNRVTIMNVCIVVCKTN